MTDARPMLAIGLISGTSMDGVDAALIACDGGPEARPQLLGFRTYPYSEPLVVQLRCAISQADAATLVRLDAAVGEEFARAALGLLRQTSVPAEEISCIGSHGQTILHLPEPATIAGVPVRGSLQIGNPAVIAARTGIVTVADFRAMDLALGGQGAPLVPLLDWRLYREPGAGRLLVNLGGIANVTALPARADLSQVLAFDTGPGNVLLDAVARDRGLPGGMDRDGELALAGTSQPDLLARLQEHPFLHRSPPKSADIGEFLDLLAALGQAIGSLSTADLLATLAELTVRSIADAVHRWIEPGVRIDEVLVSGGGVHHGLLMRRVSESFAPASVRPLPLVNGVGPESKEAVAFALLALERLAGRPGNVPAATGAAMPALLGTVVRPPTAAVDGRSRPPSAPFGP